MNIKRAVSLLVMTAVGLAALCPSYAQQKNTARPKLIVMITVDRGNYEKEAADLRG